MTPRLHWLQSTVYCSCLHRCAHVYSLAFSQDSEFLALSSNTETIHIFKLDQVCSQEDIHLYIASGCHERFFQGRLSCEPSSWGCPPRRPRRGGRGRLDGVPQQSCCLPSSTGGEVRYGFLTSSMILQSLSISAFPSHYTSINRPILLKCYQAWKLGCLDSCNM